MQTISRSPLQQTCVGEPGARSPLQLRALLACAVLLSCSTAVHAENWPAWRGPREDGTSHETNLPTTWSPTQNVAWKAPLPGPAGATPVVWKDRIFLTSVGDDGALLMLCFDTSGKQLWQDTMASGNKDVRGDEGNSASPSPSTDGTHVWAMMGTGNLACYDFDGNAVWRVFLPERFGEFKIAFGMTSTPVLHGDHLYLQLIHSGGARIVALDKRTGKTVWEHDRPSDARAECEQSYASPILYQDNERTYLVSHGADYVVAHSLADGSEIWRCGGLNPLGNYNPTLRFVASPVAVAGLIVVPSAKNGPVLGLDPAAKGDISENKKAHRWTREKNTPDVPSPLVHDGLVYLCRENGDLICLDAESGRELYYERTHRQRHRASPVYADGKVYLTARDGMISVVRAGKEFEILAQNEMGESLSSSPVISGGRIYLRTFKNLYCIEEK